jgi:hypothetical protein
MFQESAHKTLYCESNTQIRIWVLSVAQYVKINTDV